MKQRYILFILVMIFTIKGFAQNNYTATAIPFQQFTGTLNSLSTADDTYSPVINLPFNFNYYGTTFNQIIVSTNGYVNFTTSSAGGFSPWSFNQTIPNSSFPVKNSILGCFHDMDNSSGVGTITYGTYGTSPYRKFIVYFNNQPQYQCSTLRSSFQIIISETSNIVDIQLIEKPVCASWQSGRAVSGLINATGTQGIAAPGRNTGSWTAFHEGWRFSRPNYYANYSFVKCDDSADGFVNFDLTVAQNDLSPSNPSSILFFENQTDAANLVNPLPLNYYNLVPFTQIIYTRILGTTIINPITLKVIDCSTDYDNDTVSTDIEDVNADTNLANDDTDGDGIPNYLDNDDDGDLVLTNLEYVFSRNVSSLLDTDNDGIPNYLDNDDDGDGVLTWREDYDGDGNPTNDDTNNNGTPDYLDPSVAILGSSILVAESKSITLYPNPTNDILNIQNNSGEIISEVSIYSINGSLIDKSNSNNSIESISVSNLQGGIYFLKITINNQVETYKFIKK